GYVAELGTEGRLINLQMQELLFNLKDEKANFIKDYYDSEKQDLDITLINQELEKLTDIELLELERFSQILGYGKTHSSLENRVSPKGYRILSKISKLNKRDIEKLITIYEDLSALHNASEDELSEIKGMSKFKIKAIKNGLKRLKSIEEHEKY
ncbi:MAG: helix-hairpin-helix domain-containing protein, partial [Fusobacteriaceae bacterium]